MPFGFWVLGNAQGRKNGKGLLRSSLKCLSAFGFWGTNQTQRQPTRGLSVSNAFRLLGSGERSDTDFSLQWQSHSLKCLSAFGFWGTHGLIIDHGHLPNASQMPFGFWVLGDNSPSRRCLISSASSQMPFGFWVLGDSKPQ